MLLHRIRTVIAYFVGLLFIAWAFIFCRSFKISGPLRCYGWSNFRCADGEIRIGRGVRFGRIKIILSGGGRLILEDGVSLNDGVVLGVMSEIKIGKNTAIAENVMIRDYDYDFSDVEIGNHPDRYIVRKITIGQGCWLGFGCIVLKGIEIEDGVIVGAGTVVTKSLAVGEVVAGNPLRIIRKRF